MCNSLTWGISAKTSGQSGGVHSLHRTPLPPGHWSHGGWSHGTTTWRPWHSRAAQASLQTQAWCIYQKQLYVSKRVCKRWQWETSHRRMQEMNKEKYMGHQKNSDFLKSSWHEFSGVVLIDPLYLCSATLKTEMGIKLQSQTFNIWTILSGSNKKLVNGD